MLYDWADFVLNNGVFYNFNSMSTRAANTGLEHIDLNSQTVTAGYSLASDIINGSQSGIDYLGNVYHFRTNFYQQYNGSGSFGGSTSYTGVAGMPLTDVAESFKFPYDYGDAPNTYGITYHLFRTTPNLTIGSSIDYEVFNSINATADGDDNRNTGSSNDEDGVTTFPTLTVANASYSVPVRVTNSTGAAATLYGYVDFNRDGDFADGGERSAAANVPNGTTTATPITVTWTGLTGGSVGSSFIRFRLASNASEAGNRNGYSASGEVEDYPIPINASSLPVELLEFKATPIENKTTLLEWSTASELNNDYFEIQRSQNNIWETIGNVKGKGYSNELTYYTFTDNNPLSGLNYYRLKQVDFDGSIDYSVVVSVKFNEDSKGVDKNEFLVYPNPVRNEIWIKAQDNGIINQNLNVNVYNVNGETIYTDVLQNNEQRIDVSYYQKGIYFIKIGSKTVKFLKE